MSFLRKNKLWCYLAAAASVFTVFGILAVRRYSLLNEAWYLAILPAVGLVLLGIWFGMKKPAAHWRFFAVFLACGLLYLFAVPMLQVSDEPQHYLRSYEVASFREPMALGKSDVGDVMEGNLIPDAFSEPFTTSYRDILGAWNERIDKTHAERYSFPGSALYSPVSYIPQALGIGIARLVTDRSVALLYAGRISNLIIVAFLCMLAVKIFPFDKNLLMLLLLIPIYVHKAGSMSADGLTIAVVALFVSYVFYLQYETENKLKLRQLIPIYLLVFLLSQCKIVYLPVCLAFFVISPKRFGSKKRYSLHLTALILLAVVAGFGWLSISSRYLNVGYSTSGVQIMSILTDPIGYVKILLRTFKVQGMTLLEQMMGIGMGVGGVRNSRLLTLGYLVLIVLTAVFGRGKSREHRQKRDKWLLLLAAFGVALLTCTALYIQWTAPGFETIMGLQGRYFLPVLMLTMIAVGRISKLDRIRKKLPWEALTFIAAGWNLVCAVSCFAYGMTL